MLRTSVGSTEAAEDVVARVGGIDRSIGEPRCPRRWDRPECCRTDARKILIGLSGRGVFAGYPCGTRPRWSSLIREMQVMRQEEPGRGDLTRPPDCALRDLPVLHLQLLARLHQSTL
jgi:hypothetical protein